MKKQNKQKIKNIWNKIKKPLMVFSIILNILFALALVIGLSSNNKKTHSVSALDNQTFNLSSDNSFTLKVVDNIKYWNGTLEYSTNNSSWSIWNGTTTLTSDSNGNTYNIYLRGSMNTYITGSTASNSKAKWVLTGSNIRCSGNIENLLDYHTVHPTMDTNAFRYLFSGNESLITAPELGATTLTNYCYYNMFRGCTSLTTAPVLPATIVKQYSYSYMFYGCSSLRNAPVLPATTTDFACYSSMFYGCTSLVTLPDLPATTLQNFCYSEMFYGCTNIKLSASQNEEYNVVYRIPTTGNASAQSSSLFDMFANTGGTFTGTPSLNTTYYTIPYVAPEPEPEPPVVDTEYSKTITLGESFNPVTYITKNGDYIFNGFAGYNPDVTTNYVDLIGLDFVSNGFEYNRIRLVYSEITAVAPTITQDGSTYMTLDGTYSNYACCAGMFYQYLDENNNIVRNVQVTSNRRTIIDDNGVQVKTYDVRQPYTIWLNNNFKQLEVISDDEIVITDSLLSVTGLTTYQLLQVTSSVNDSVMGMTDVFGLLKGAFSGITGILSISILPGITLGLLLFIPLIVTIIVVIVRLIKK